MVPLVSLSAAQRPPEAQAIRAAVEAYSAGNWQRAVESIDSRQVKAQQLTRELDAWIREADASSRLQRSIAAVAFALDVGWTATRPVASTDWSLPTTRSDFGASALTFRTSQGFVATWAARQLPAAGPVSATERTLWLAVIGVASDGTIWRSMLTDILPLARKRLPDAPRVRLATAVAQTVVEVGALRYRSWNGILNFSVLREENLPSSVTKAIPGAIETLDALLANASLAGEVELRIGYLELRRRNWPAALARFEAVRGKTSDPILLATTDYLAGWVHEQLDQPDEAIAAYRRAIAITPTQRNLATRLAALLYLDGERSEAFHILDRALNARPIAVDLLISLERGDGRFVDEWLSSVRQRLKETSARDLVSVGTSRSDRG